MKNFKTFICILSASILATSCSSDNEEKTNIQIFEKENPQTVYYSKSGFSKITNITNVIPCTTGLVFTPNTKGNITDITLRLPIANPAVKVTIWDYPTKTILRTETVNIPIAELQYTQGIPALTLEKGKKYLITMFTDNWYLRKKEDNTNIDYPVTAGNITINEFRWENYLSQTFPTNVTSNYYCGDLSFIFQQTK